ncbi:hypothetical protein NicSoilB8_09400 [Arthrobacter sp. NicSoilB8]|nr:hypothetical protein NicSoilB8_09400 [Arthrobacter sp. NicSoilB8]
MRPGHGSSHAEEQRGVTYGPFRRPGWAVSDPALQFGGGSQARRSRHASDTVNTTAPSPSITNTMSPQLAWVTPLP